jgi:hypothetical protein
MKPSLSPADVSSAGRRRQDAPIRPRSTESRPDADRIAQRAYERYEARGRGDGHDMDDWLEAERELQQDVSSNRTAGGVNSDEAA